MSTVHSILTKYRQILISTFYYNCMVCLHIHYDRNYLVNGVSKSITPNMFTYPIQFYYGTFTLYYISYNNRAIWLSNSNVNCYLYYRPFMFCRAVSQWIFTMQTVRLFVYTHTRYVSMPFGYYNTTHTCNIPTPTHIWGYTRLGVRNRFSCARNKMQRAQQGL